MADDNITLLQALQGGLFRPTDSMAGMGAQVVASSLPSLMNPYASAGSNLTTTLGGGILGGLLAGFARGDANDQNAELRPLMGQIMRAEPGQREKLLAGADAQTISRVSPLLQALEFDDFGRQNRITDSAKSKVGEFDALRSRQLGQRVDEGLINAGMNQGLALTGKGVTPFGDLQLKTPIELETARIAATEGAKNEAEILASGFNPKKETELNSLRKEFNALPEVKTYSIVEKVAGIVDKAISDPSAMSDLELVRYAILAIEPGMAVREGEQAAVTNSQSVPEALKGQWLRAMNGESSLSAPAREGIRNLMIRSFEGHKAQYDKTLAFYQNEATAKNLDPSRLSYIGSSPEADTILGKNQATVSSGGKNYRVDQATKTLIEVP